VANDGLMSRSFYQEKAPWAQGTDRIGSTPPICTFPGHDGLQQSVLGTELGDVISKHGSLCS